MVDDQKAVRIPGEETVALGRFRMDLRGWCLERELVRGVPG